MSDSPFEFSDELFEPPSPKTPQTKRPSYSAFTRKLLYEQVLDAHNQKNDSQTRIASLLDLPEDILIDIFNRVADWQATRPRRFGPIPLALCCKYIEMVTRHTRLSRCVVLMTHRCLHSFRDFVCSETWGPDMAAVIRHIILVDSEEWMGYALPHTGTDVISDILRACKNVVSFTAYTETITAALSLGTEYPHSEGVQLAIGDHPRAFASGGIWDHLLSAEPSHYVLRSLTHLHLHHRFLNVGNGLAQAVPDFPRLTHLALRGSRHPTRTGFHVELRSFAEMLSCFGEQLLVAVLIFRASKKSAPPLVDLIATAKSCGPAIQVLVLHHQAEMKSEGKFWRRWAIEGNNVWSLAAKQMQSVP
uniref:F-box domain-containing protein n=1 Tax=Mycena chlorophos TaxID=658473 RepID=A0ABQ0L5Z8_MYCCL|nr:predicted protein [Mycena chlorophos]